MKQSRIGVPSIALLAAAAFAATAFSHASNAAVSPRAHDPSPKSPPALGAGNHLALRSPFPEGEGGQGVRSAAKVSFAHLPMYFEANRGQTDSRVKFLSHGAGYTLFITNDGATLALRSASPASASPAPVLSRERTPSTREAIRPTAGEGSGSSARAATAASTRAGLNRISLSETARRGYNSTGGFVGKSQTAAARAAEKKEKMPNEANFLNDYGRFSSKELASFSRRGAIRPPPTPAKGWSRAEALSLPKGEPRERGRGEIKAAREEVLRMRLIGANRHAQAIGLDALPGKANYFIGNNPKQWHTNIPTYAKVELKNVYPGIDLVYYGGSASDLTPFPFWEGGTRRERLQVVPLS
ncbi:MAG: hypothetical protein ACREQI_00275 [Candidatus Binataceae bacterium]